MPRVGRTLLVASAVTLAGIAALFVGVRLHRHPSPEPAITVAATTTPSPAPAPQVSPVKPKPKEVAVVIPRGTAGPAEVVHTVAPGETLWSIAARYTNDPWSWPQLAARNGIADANLIRPGDQVRIVFEARPGTPAESPR